MSAAGDTDRRLVHSEIDDRIAVITLDNPPANSLAPQARDQLDAAIREAAADDRVWCLIITAAGEKFFMAGANIPSLLDLDKDGAKARVEAAGRFFANLAACPKPVVAAINGSCLGGGLEMALCCDVLVCAPHARLGLPEAGLGIMPGGGGTQRLPRVVGQHLARYLVFTGDTLDADAALAAGLVQKVAEPGKLLETALEVCKRINRMGPLGVRAAKQAMRAAQQQPLAKGLETEAELWAGLFGTQDKNEGVNAFVQKRRPQFTAA